MIAQLPIAKVLLLNADAFIEPAIYPIPKQRRVQNAEQAQDNGFERQLFFDSG